MPPESPQLPPKPEVALALLQTASSVYVHLDPRRDDVHVPSWFKQQPQLVLQVGLNMAVEIPDLDVGHEAISCTLSFNRRPEFCKIPWDAIYGLVGEDGRGMIWPESVPPEVAASADGRSPVAAVPKSQRPQLRLAHSEVPEASDDSSLDSSNEKESTPDGEKKDIEASPLRVASAPVPEETSPVDPAALIAQKASQEDKPREKPSHLRLVK